MHRMFLCLVSMILVHPVIAIDIGAMTAIMEPTSDFMARTVTNNDSSPKVYEVRVEQISNPTTSGYTLAMPPNELLYTPKRFVLHGGQRQNIKFYYKGPEDKQERYYRVFFVESPAAHLEQSSLERRRGTLELNIEVQSILVMRPRQEKFNYELDETQGSIRNTGNTFFEFIVKRGCDEPDSTADTKYLLPGETWHNDKITQSGNQKIIVYNHRFMAIGHACSPLLK
ncbi:fimbria/pilus periplasmic chaperone [Aeromonas hydrophila]|uniref:fimbria/pilus periplasmic chaperone n=1 Tax=Aeromonas hydrophila TaxID=644 RepID=UPI001303A894|nr:fimbria/pilus periplasmic chaperone [Aeromonas hydrophila]QGZ71099.1 fimbria/pilus periplasmic chaperone [Aeromonas hydrophila]